MKSHQNLVKIVLILFITFFTPIIDENSLQASDLYKKNLGIATWANDTTLSGWRNNLGWKTHSKQHTLYVNSTLLDTIEINEFNISIAITCRT